MTDVGRQRARLVDALCEAAELEHSLCLQYLYAAFSLKMRPAEGDLDEVQADLVRDWKGQLLLLAREEMLHLGLVLNLLAAVGGAPYLRRPNFPQPERYYPVGVVAALTPFDLPALDRFIAYELPTACLPGYLAHGSAPRRTVGQLYADVRELILSVDEKDLFIGSPTRQVDTTAVIDPEGVFDDDVTVGYGVEPFAIADRAAALRAVDLIVEQGEGTEEPSPDSHHARLVRVREQYVEELADAERRGQVFVPARPVLNNPALALTPDTSGATLITAGLAREAAELFDAGYALMILMLLRFYSRVEESQVELKEIQRIAFFPLMTMFIRPLGEILSELPATAGGGPGTAGPPFEFRRGLQLIPERNVARQVFAESLDDIADRSRRLARRMSEEAVGRHLVAAAAVLADDVGRIARSYRETTDWER